MLNISHSKLRKITTCLYQYKLYYIDGWRRRQNKAIFAFGHVCHEVVTRSLVDRFRTDPDKLFIEQWNKHEAALLHYNANDSFDKLMTTGRDLCRQIPRDLKGITGVSDVEKQFTAQLGAINLNGYTDFTGRYKRKLTLFEIKTMRSCTDYETEISDQLTLYSMVKGIPRVGTVALIKTANNPHIEIHTADKTKDDYINLKHKIARAAQDISRRYYPKVNDKMTCQMCDFLPICFGTKSEVKAKLKQIDTQHHTKNIQQRRRLKMSFW